MFPSAAHQDRTKMANAQTSNPPHPRARALKPAPAHLSIQSTNFPAAIENKLLLHKRIGMCTKRSESKTSPFPHMFSTYMYMEMGLFWCWNVLFVNNDWAGCPFVNYIWRFTATLICIPFSDDKMMVCKHTIYECFSMWFSCGCGYWFGEQFLAFSTRIRKYALGTQNTFAQQIRGYATTREGLSWNNLLLQCGLMFHCSAVNNGVISKWRRPVDH